MLSGHDVTGLSDALGVGVVIDRARAIGELTALLNEVCARAEDRGGQTVVVLRLGSPEETERAWPAGPVTVRDVGRWERAVRRLERLHSVSIAAAEGICTGPALDLLLAADYRIATTDLRLLLPVNDGQFWPGMAVHRLTVQLGLARARKLVLWGTEVPAVTAEEIGLVDQLTADLSDAVRDASVWLGRLSGPELAIRRQLLLESPATGYDEALGAHLAACDRELRRTRRTGAGDE